MESKMTKGSRVKLSQDAIDKGISKNQINCIGTVLGVEKWSQSISVHWDNLGPKTIYSYHPDFLEVVNDQAH